MGYYLNSYKDVSLLPLLKAEQITAIGGATVITADEARVLIQRMDYSADVVVVVKNGGFDAVAFAYSIMELEEFLDPRDHRARTIMVVPDASFDSGYNTWNLHRKGVARV